MQFSNFNADPYGGDGPPPVMGGPYPFLNQRRMRGRGCFGCLRALLVVLVLGVLLFVGITYMLHTTLVAGPTTISVAAHPTLVISSTTYADNPLDVPFIHIHAGSTNNHVQILASRPLNLPIWFPVRYEASSDGKVLLLNLSEVSAQQVDITVPATSDLKIDTNSATVQIDGISGQMVVDANGGIVTITHCTITGPSLINNNSGGIKALQDTLSGQVTLSNNSGSTAFDGKIAPTGNYIVKSNGGPITVGLPGDATFHVDATTNNGSIISTYPGIRVQGAEIHADMGNPPRASLTMINNNGSITLSAQQ